MFAIVFSIRGIKSILKAGDQREINGITVIARFDYMKELQLFASSGIIFHLFVKKKLQLM